MDLYANDLTDYIYQENDMKKKRALLCELEAKIKRLMNRQDKGNFDYQRIAIMVPILLT